MAQHSGKEAGIVQIDVNGSTGIKRGVVLARELKICQDGEKTNAFGAVVGGREAMNRTKAGCKIDQFMSDGPAKGRMGLFEATIRNSEDGGWGVRGWKCCSRSQQRGQKMRNNRVMTHWNI